LAAKPIDESSANNSNSSGTIPAPPAKAVQGMGQEDENRAAFEIKRELTEKRNSSPSAK
jgi:hypothetical protein